MTGAGCQPAEFSFRPFPQSTIISFFKIKFFPKLKYILYNDKANAKRMPFSSI